MPEERTLTGPEQELREVFAPTAIVRLHLLLDDFGQEGADENLAPLVFSPIAYHVERNSYLEADTAEVTLDLEEFPIDPRIVRGGTFELYQAATPTADPGCAELP